MSPSTRSRPRPTNAKSVVAVVLLFVALLALPPTATATTTVPFAPPSAVPLAPATPGATTSDPPTASDSPTAAAPSLPTAAPLQSGFTPADVAERPVPGPPTQAPPVSATGAVLFDPADGMILAGVQPRVPLPMASTTKIMTVLLALEAVEEGIVAPQLTVTATAAATGQLPGVATLGLTEGDVVEVRDVLAAELLRSGNDGAVAIAEHVAGSEPTYVAQMNQRAVTLGLEQTQFLDASGLSNDPAHHATPLDLALLGQEAMTHPDFATWAGSATLAIPEFGTLENRNELLQAYPGTTGIKTGFTNLAGECLVASVQRDGRTLYAVVLGSTDRVSDTTALFDHGFTDFARPQLLTAGDVAASYRTALGTVPMSVAEELTRTVAVGAEVGMQTRLAPDVGLPLEAGTPLGEAVMLVDGEEVDRTPLLADQALGVQGDSAPAALADALRAFARLADRQAPVPL